MFLHPHQEDRNREVDHHDHVESEIERILNGNTSDKEPYYPSPEEIEDECRQIRSTWSEDEHRKRSGQPCKPLEIATTPCRISSGFDEY